LDTYLKTGVANHRSLAQRIEYTNAALTIIKENFWLGVGTGNWKKAYRDHYIENDSQMEAARFGNVHNQYLNYMVKFGLIGFLYIMFAILYPVVKTKAYKNPLFFLFLVIMFIGNLGDANFETHTGSNFFVFFYCLFFIQESGK
jgi:O-antigen ligase